MHSRRLAHHLSKPLIQHGHVRAILPLHDLIKAHSFNQLDELFPLAQLAHTHLGDKDPPTRYVPRRLARLSLCCEQQRVPLRPPECRPPHFERSKLRRDVLDDGAGEVALEEEVVAFDLVRGLAEGGEGLEHRKLEGGAECVGEDGGDGERGVVEAL